ncbi:MAG: DUF4142 domain-containing protein [Acidobacteria bacterium]|nr:DUF4142 domain-containing protein [Acidobacteriota bacterium]
MRNVTFLTMILLLIFAGLSACGGGVANTASNAGNTVSNAASSAVNTIGNAANSVANSVSSATTASPESFMKDAAQGGMAEVEMGKLAAQKATDPEVKKFGQMMVTDHTAANNELKGVAGKKNFALPADLGSHQSDLDKLKGLSGADFDKEYVEMMVSDHETDVSLFEKQSEYSTDPDVKAFAAKTLPTLKKHLDAIKAIQAKKSGAGSNSSTSANKK